VYLQSAGDVRRRLLLNSSEGRGFPAVNQSAAVSNYLGFEWWAFIVGWIDWLIFAVFSPASVDDFDWLLVWPRFIDADWLVACADDSASFLLTLFRCPVFGVRSFGRQPIGQQPIGRNFSVSRAIQVRTYNSPQIF